MSALLRFIGVYNTELLFLAATALLLYAVARFASVRWQLAIMFSFTPALAFLMHNDRMFRDLKFLFL